MHGAKKQKLKMELLQTEILLHCKGKQNNADYLQIGRKHLPTI
jgi:hypothetical protein